MEELITKFISSGQPSSAIILAVLAVGLGKFLEKFLNKDHVQFTEDISHREQCREDMDLLRAELVKFRSEENTWREKYWEQINKNSILHASIASLERQVADLRDELMVYETRQGNLSRKVSEFFDTEESGQ